MAVIALVDATEMVNIPKGAPVVYVSFSAQIDANTTESLIAVAASCAVANVKKVYLALSTPGGSVMNGVNIYNVLKAMPFELTTHNVEVVVLTRSGFDWSFGCRPGDRKEKSDEPPHVFEGSRGYRGCGSNVRGSEDQFGALKACLRFGYR